jgi:hypothetical protein
MMRGGKRAGAGRKVGRPNKASIARQEKVAAEGITPLDVMLENMRHFHKVASDAEAVLEGLTYEEFSGRSVSPEEQFKALLAEVKKAAGLRQIAQECARDAASYVHPRLAAINHTGDITTRYVAEVPAVATDTDSWERQHAPASKTMQ